MSNEWRTSSYSQNGGQCVQVRDRSAAVDVRDSVHPEAGHVTFSASEWAALVTSSVEGDR
ncbi:DUF397 domain-containing protein [Nocardiopsis tropica]|uniref:DUF397 domain-containing protein n=1 Tax=Nocardiopsis tropica TaxID=109330 RepID=A0ABU7KIZ4_9ACTN|nr:DUF397 domain-containing protein [Nocardiopsis umidischolae]MEE2049264.1 DUF397 domain-containing protein [Nocardiopsis umidischolae]